MVIFPEEIVFSMMEDSDLESVVNLESLAYEYPWSGKIIQGCFEAGYRIWIGKVGLTHICQAFVSVVAGEAHLLNLAVHPKWQKNGCGKAILRRVIEDIKLLNVEGIFLEVRISNHLAISLYEKFGFSQIGERRNYYPASDGRENAIMLGLQLRFP